MVVFIVVLLILFAVMYAVVSGSTGSQRKKAVENQDELLEELFAGDPETVSYTATLVNLPADAVIAEAHRRGYQVIADSQTTYGPRRLVFGRPQPS